MSRMRRWRLPSSRTSVLHIHNSTVLAHEETCRPDPMLILLLMPSADNVAMPTHQRLVPAKRCRHLLRLDRSRLCGNGSNNQNCSLGGAAPMPLTTLSSRELNMDLGRAKRAAMEGPVIITDRGQPAHVLLSFEDFQKITGQTTSVVEAVGLPEGIEDIEIDFEASRERPGQIDLI